MKKILGIAVIGIILAFTSTGCDEYSEKVASAAMKAYGDVRPEVLKAIASYINGDINKTQLINVGSKFGESYIVERVIGESNE